jgi:hypothetical protein
LPKRGQSEPPARLEILFLHFLEHQLLSKSTSTHATTNPIMIPRTLLRQTRAVSSSIRTVPRTSLIRPQFRPSNLSSPPASRPATSRWYSTEQETKKAEGDAAAELKTEETAAEAEDPTKKELEAKNKEIIDLKVTPPSFPFRPFSL